MPFTEKNEDMPKMGWVKELTYDWIVETRDGRFFKETYYVTADMFPCSTCHTADFVWLRLMRTGVVWACWGCKTAGGAMTTEAFVLVDRKEVSMEEAYKIAKANDQQDLKKMFPPEKLALMERKKKQMERFKRRIKKKK